MTADVRSSRGSQQSKHLIRAHPRQQFVPDWTGQTDGTQNSRYPTGACVSPPKPVELGRRTVQRDSCAVGLLEYCQQQQQQQHLTGLHFFFSRASIFPAASGTVACKIPAACPRHDTRYGHEPRLDRRSQVQAGAARKASDHSGHRQWRLHAESRARVWFHHRRRRAPRRAQLHRPQPPQEDVRRRRARAMPRLQRDPVPPAGREGVCRQLGGAEGDLGPPVLR